MLTRKTTNSELDSPPLPQRLCISDATPARPVVDWILVPGGPPRAAATSGAAVGAGATDVLRQGRPSRGLLAEGLGDMEHGLFVAIVGK